MRTVAVTLLITCVAGFAVAADRSVGVPFHKDRLTYPGLPTISYRSDPAGRLVDVVVDGRSVLQYDWSAAEVPSVRFADQWTIRTELLDSKTIRQETFDFNGERIRLATPSLKGRRYARLPVVLDAVAEELALPASWRDTFRFTGQDSAAIAHGGGELALRLQSMSPGRRIGFIDGTAAFWDLDLPVDFGGRLAGVLPTRLVVTRSGALQLSAPKPLYDALETVWTGPDGSTETHARFVTEQPRQDRVRSEMYWVCGYSEHWWCTSYGDWGYCGNYYEPYYCYSNADQSGGGSSGEDPELTNIKREYEISCGYVPDDSELVTARSYQPGPLHQYGFSDLKSPQSPYAIITAELQGGLANMIVHLDNQTPTLTDAYRTPSERPAGSAGCGGHTRGTAVDLSIRNETGAFDCRVWNYMAAAANASGGWVESWADTVAGGDPHLHIDWGRPANTPQEYGTCTGY